MNRCDNKPKPINLYLLMQRFWRENEYDPFSTAEIAMYFFLIDRANRRRWEMPFKCPTSAVSAAIKVTRQSVVNARESLRERNLITYSKGTSKGSYPMYSLVLTDSLTESLPDGLTEDLRGILTENLPEDLTPYNIEDRNIKDKISSSNKKDDARILSLDELEALLVSDEPWLNEIISLLSSSHQIELSDLKSYLTDFFRYLRCQGSKGREEADCRRHFVNWLRKQPIDKLKTNATKQPTNDTRRSSDVTASSARDYEGAF